MMDPVIAAGVRRAFFMLEHRLREQVAAATRDLLAAVGRLNGDETGIARLEATRDALELTAAAVHDTIADLMPGRKP